MNSTQVHHDHLDEFKRCFDAPPAFKHGDMKEAGDVSKKYDSIIGNSNGSIKKLPMTLNRKNLLDLAKRPEAEISTTDLSAAILVWGGVRDNNGALLVKGGREWIQVGERIRAGEYTRAQAYDKFRQLKKNEDMKGMGPAYFTKLIYFLMPDSGANPKGYIMDQWLACSINLLFGQATVKVNENVMWQSAQNIRVNSTVSDENTGQDYETFCRAIEYVWGKMGAGWTPDAVELALMSKGGKRPERWRKYVTTHRIDRFRPVVT